MSSGLNTDELHLAAFALEVGDLFWLLRSRSAVVGQVGVIRSALQREQGLAQSLFLVGFCARLGLAGRRLLRYAISSGF
jgi:hypothetical protein